MVELISGFNVVEPAAHESLDRGESILRIIDKQIASGFSDHNTVIATVVNNGR